MQIFGICMGNIQPQNTLTVTVNFFLVLDNYLSIFRNNKNGQFFYNYFFVVSQHLLTKSARLQDKTKCTLTGIPNCR